MKIKTSSGQTRAPVEVEEMDTVLEMNRGQWHRALREIRSVGLD